MAEASGRVVKRIAKTVLMVAPYLIIGFSAPAIFKSISDPNRAGHIAGMLFIAAVLWAIFLCVQWNLPSAVKIFFVVFLFLQAIFLSWRFFNSEPLKTAYLLGLSGSVWHVILTSFYLLGVVILSINLARSVK